MTSDIARALSLKYLIRDAGKVLSTPALQDAGKVSVHLATAFSGTAIRHFKAEIMSEKGQVVTEMLW